MAPKNKNNGGKKRPSSLKNVIMQNFKGDIALYLSMRTPLDIQRDSVRTFRDVAMGNVDLQFEGQAFLDANFMQNAMIACQAKCSQAYTRCKGEEMLLQHPEVGIPVNIIQENLANDQASYQAYSIMLNMLNSICASGNLEHINVTAALINQNRLKYNL